MKNFPNKTFLYVYQDWSRVEFSDTDDFGHIHVVVKSPPPKKNTQELIEYIEQFEHQTVVVSHSIEDAYDLSFLEQLPRLNTFALNAHLFKDFDQVKFIPENLERLSLGATNSLRLSLRFLENLKRLRYLSLEKHKKDIDVVSELTTLEQLDIRSITMPNLDFMSGLENLKAIEIRLGGTKNLDLLPSFKHLEYLELWAINKIESIDIISKIESLNSLYLDQLKNVKDISSLANLKELKSIGICRMKGLESLQWAADAPNLESMSVTETTHLTKEDFKPFVGHKTLKEANIYIGRKHSLEVREMLGLPEIGESGNKCMHPTSDH